MANKLDPMDIKQIISLHLDGLSNRKTAELLDIGRNKVNACLQLFHSCVQPLEKLKELLNHQLKELSPTHTTIDNACYNQPMPYFEKLR